MNLTFIFLLPLFRFEKSRANIRRKFSLGLRMCNELCNEGQENHSLHTIAQVCFSIPMSKSHAGKMVTEHGECAAHAAHGNKTLAEHAAHAEHGDHTNNNNNTNNNNRKNTIIAALLSRAKARREEKIATLQTRRVIQCLLARCLERREKKRILAHHHALKQACK